MDVGGEGVWRFLIRGGCGCVVSGLDLGCEVGWGACLVLDSGKR